MQAAKQIRLSRKRRRSALVSRRSIFSTESIHLKQNSRLLADGGDLLDRVERGGAVVRVGEVGVQQRQIELDVHGLLEELAGQVQPRLGGVDVLVERQHEVVGDDRVTGREERDQPADHVLLARRQLGEVGDVGVEVDLLDGPGVLDRVPVALVEVRVAHGAQGQLEARVEQVLVRSLGSLLAGLAGLGVFEGAGDAPRGRWPAVREWGGGRGRRRRGRSGSPGASAGSTSSSGPASRRTRTSS